MIAATNPDGALVDAHVHLYDCFDIHEFLTGASGNFRAAADGLGIGGTATNVLMLTETDREHGFERLLRIADSSQSERPAEDRWSVRRIPDDPNALLATSAGGGAVIVIAGRQLVSAEGLEVLALGTDAAIGDGSLLAELVGAIGSHDAIPVIPWGVGKWLGRRGRVVKSFLRSATHETCFLGDILGRPPFWPRSSIFRMAAARGIGVLPGTDPLPLESDSGRAGSCCFHIDCNLTSAPPSEALKNVLRRRGIAIRPFVRRETPWRFVRNQARLRLR